MTRKTVDTLVLWIAWLGTAAILAVFLFVPAGQAETKRKKARLTGGQAIDKAAKAWKHIYDYQTILHQIQTFSNGNSKEVWSRIQLVNPTEEKPDLQPTLLIELFDRPIPLEQGIPLDATPSKIYFADASRRFFTLNPAMNTITIEPLDEKTAPLPEFMYLAGFLDFDIEEFKEKAYIHADVYQETIGDIETYQVQIKPRVKKRDVEPWRYLWIDRKTSLPIQFVQEGSVKTKVTFYATQINQNLNSEDLIPPVREDAIIDDKT